MRTPVGGAQRVWSSETADDDLGGANRVRGRGDDMSHAHLLGGRPRTVPHRHLGPGFRETPGERGSRLPGAENSHPVLMTSRSAPAPPARSRPQSSTAPR